MTSTARTGLFFCTCAGNIGQVVRIGELGQAGRWPGAAAVETRDVLCSSEGQAWLRGRIEALGLTHLVVAACSPREHEQTFRQVMAAAGRSPWLSHLVNVREQVEWAGGAPAAATARAASLVSAGLARVLHHRHLEAESIEVTPDVLVVGGGPAGTAAALGLAGKDRRVLLVERAPALGGLAGRLDEIFPDLACASCFMEPALDELLHHERIEVLTESEVRAVRGSAGRFEVELALSPRVVSSEACVGCGQCAAACPVELPDPWNAGLGTRKAIGPAYPGSLPHRSAIDAAACLRTSSAPQAGDGAPCQACADACPFGAIDLAAVATTRTIEVGAIVLATGLVPGEVPGGVAAAVPGLLSTYQLERLLHPSGPGAGALTRPGGGAPTSLLLAARADGLEGDGELAIRELLKLAHLVRKKHPAVMVTVAGGLHRAPGQAAAARALAADGVVLLDEPLVEGSAQAVAGGVAVRLGPAAAGGTGQARRFDLVVLHTPTAGAPEAAVLARLLRLRPDARGFLSEGGASPFEPAATLVPGVFVAGAAAGPRSIREAIRDGAAAAGRVLATLVPGERRSIEPLVATIDAATCGACGACVPACAFHAITRDASGRIVLDPVHCRGCGTCAAACPTGAAEARHYSRDAVAAEIRALLAGAGGGDAVTVEPKILAFLCRWCAGAAADQAGRSRLPLPHSLLTVEVPCSGRVEPAFVLQAFREGADGVLIAGCHPGDCHYVDGNLRAHARHALLVRALGQAGLEPERLQLLWAGASEAERLVAAAQAMTDDLRRLGPLDLPRRALAVSAPAELERAPRGLPPRAPGKPRVAFYWNASCGGCEEAVVDLGEGFADLAARVDIVLWPVAMDWKRADVEAMPDGHIDVAFLNGALRLDEQEDWARLLRRKARTVVAFGACAHLGGVVGLGNLSTPRELLDAAYRDAPTVSNPEGPGPGDALPGDPRPGDPAAGPHLPALLPRTLPLAGAIEVDAVLPGCPPSTAGISAALEPLLTGAPLPPGVILAPNASLCDSCPRKDSKPERLELDSLRRLDTTQPDEATCFLAQGLVCLGPGTRQGCQPGCLEVNMPCRGCFGPLDGVADAGAAALAAMASLLHGDEAAILRLAAELPDPAGLFWRYGYAAGLVPLRLPGGRP